MSVRDDRLLLYFECLVALAETQHFGKAAQRIGLSQPAFSQAIKSLETMCGTVIIDRLRRFTGLTADGEMVLRHARRIVGEVRDFRLAVASRDPGERAVIRLGSVPSTLVTASLMTQELHKSYPQLSVTVQVQSAPALHRMVQADQLSAAICYVSPARQEDLQVTALYRERYKLVLPEAWPGLNAPTAEWEELANVPLGLLEAGYQFRAMVEEALVAAGVQPKIAVESNSLTALLTQASMGDCAVIVPAMFLSVIPLPAGLRVMPLREPEIGYSVCLIINRNRVDTEFGRTITAICQSVRPVLQDILAAENRPVIPAFTSRHMSV